MLIRSDDLEHQLTKALEAGVLAPVWIVIDEEPLLAMEAIDQLRQTATQLGYTDRKTFALSATSDWSELLDSILSVSLFDDKKVITLRFLSSSPGVKGAKILQQFIEVAPTVDGTVTIVHLTQVDYKTQKTPWFKALASIGHVVNCLPIPRPHYLSWIEQRLKRQNQSMQDDALRFFAEQTEGNLMAAKQELTKLSLLYPARELSLREVEDCVMNVSRYSVEDLIETIAYGDVARLCRTINGMQAEGEALPLIIMRISSFIRDAIAISEGENVFCAPATKQALQRFIKHMTANKLANALARCADIDRLAKGLTVQTRNDVWSELKNLCVFLAHVPTRKNI